jgi:hypothetical protein
VRIAFTLGCCDREAVSCAATTARFDRGDVCDLLIDGSSAASGWPINFIASRLAVG